MTSLITQSPSNMNCEERAFCMFQSPEYQRVIELTRKRRRLDRVLEELTIKRENELSDKKKKLLEYLIKKYIPRTLNYYNKTIESIVNRENERVAVQSGKCTGKSVEFIEKGNDANLNLKGETEYPAYLSNLFV